MLAEAISPNTRSRAHPEGQSWRSEYCIPMISGCEGANANPFLRTRIRIRLSAHSVGLILPFSMFHKENLRHHFRDIVFVVVPKQDQSIGRSLAYFLGLSAGYNRVEGLRFPCILFGYPVDTQEYQSRLLSQSREFNLISMISVSSQSALANIVLSSSWYINICRSPMWSVARSNSSLTVSRLAEQNTPFEFSRN